MEEHERSIRAWETVGNILKTAKHIGEYVVETVRGGADLVRTDRPTHIEYLNTDDNIIKGQE